MRRVSILLSVILCTILILSSCSLPAESVIPAENSMPAEDTETAPLSGESILTDESKWPVVQGIETNYVKLDDINPEAVPEIKLGFSIDRSGCIIKESDDGFICGKTVALNSSADSKENEVKPAILKLDKSGKVIWEKEYDYITHQGRLNNLLVCPDGSFVFSLSAYPYYNNNGYIFEKSFIIKCDIQGNVLWKQDFDDYSGEMLHNLFISESGMIFTVGHWRTINGKQAMDGADDIVIMELDKDGNLLKQKVFGGSDFDSLNSAVYDDELGIIINGRSQSKDGDFAIDKDETGRDFIACIDKNLDLKWVCLAGQNESFCYDQAVIYNGFTYVPGGTIRTGTLPSGFIIKLDKDGKKVWTKTDIFTGYWARAISILQNGDIVIGSGNQNQGAIVIFDQKGNEKKRLEDLKFAPGSITPVQDGGFIVTATREIKTIPQPPVISSIWFDTELVAVKYKNDYSVEYRKTYDKYKDKLDGDFALPLENGKIIVEG